MKFTKWLALFMVLFIATAYAATPSEKKASQKTASQASDAMLPSVSDSSPPSGFVELDVDGKKVKAAYLDETLGDRHGAVLILPDQDENIDSRGIVHRLRYGLLSAGWATMTLAMNYPFKANIYLWPKAGDKTDKKKTTKAATDKNHNAAAAKKTSSNAPPDNQQRITAALAYLKTKGIKRVIVLGHGKGGVAAAQAAMQNASEVNALILVATPKLEQSLQTAQANIAVADFYGDLDRNNVLDAIKNRRAFMHNQPQSLYASRKIWGAAHNFYGLQQQLLTAVRGWLHNHFVKQMEP